MLNIFHYIFRLFWKTSALIFYHFLSFKCLANLPVPAGAWSWPHLRAVWPDWPELRPLAHTQNGPNPRWWKPLAVLSYRWRQPPHAVLSYRWRKPPHAVLSYRWTARPVWVARRTWGRGRRRARHGAGWAAGQLWGHAYPPHAARCAGRPVSRHTCIVQTPP